MDSATSADTRSDEDLLDAARHGDEAALAVLVERHRGPLERMVRLRMDRRLQGRADPADVALSLREIPCRSRVYECVGIVQVV